MNREILAQLVILFVFGVPLVLLAIVLFANGTKDHARQAELERRATLWMKYQAQTEDQILCNWNNKSYWAFDPKTGKSYHDLWKESHKQPNCPPPWEKV